MFPAGGIRRGSTLAVRGSTSLLCALLAEASATGSWCAVVGVPTLGALAAAEAGVTVDRLALVPHPGSERAEVVAALHPTPAVAGVPSQAALRFIAEHEGIDRGLYAGLVGWVAPGRAELAVALRSALVRGRRARLFVGAGIVEGSSAEQEFEETEMKARALLDALGVAR